MKQKHDLSSIRYWELTTLVVIAVVAVLFLRPIIHQHRRENLQQGATCISNQRMIGAAIQMYTEDHEDILPVSTTVWRDITLYSTKNSGSFVTAA